MTVVQDTENEEKPVKNIIKIFSKAMYLMGL
jgi:hypothetical protein